LWTPEEAVAHALAVTEGRPIILADTQDNPGGGGTSDTTGLLRAVIEARAPSAVLALIADGDLANRAHAAGEGGLLTAQPLGGRYGPAGVTPLVEDWEVVRLGDGRFAATGPMYAGSAMDLGPMALLRPRRASGVEVAVSTRRVQAADQAILRHLGVEPAARRILALKSSVHFRADFAPLASEILVVRAPGACVVDPTALPFRRLPNWLRRCPRA
jgi:microcystin degradation protein MlrC